MPLWYAGGLILLIAETWLHRPIASGPGLLLAMAAGLWALTIAFTVAVLVPINNRLASMSSASPDPGWKDEHATWNRLHSVRVAALGIAVILLLRSVLRLSA